MVAFLAGGGVGGRVGGVFGLVVFACLLCVETIEEISIT